MKKVVYLAVVDVSHDTELRRSIPITAFPTVKGYENGTLIVYADLFDSKHQITKFLSDETFNIQKSYEGYTFFEKNCMILNRYNFEYKIRESSIIVVKFCEHILEIKIT